MSFGLICNILCVMTFSRMDLKKPVNFLFISLAVVDVSGLALNILIRQGIRDIECFSKALSIFMLTSVHLATLLLRFVNPFITLLIGFIRYFVMSNNNKFKYFFTLKSSKVILAFLIIASIVLYIPISTNNEVILSHIVVNSTKECYLFYDIGSLKYEYYLLSLYVTQFAALLVVSCLILHRLYVEKRETSVLDTVSQNRSRQNTNTAVYIISTIVFFSLLTLVSHLIYQFSSIASYSSYITYVFTETFRYLNNIVNLFIYLISSEFRKSLKSLLCPCNKVLETNTKAKSTTSEWNSQR